VVATRQLKVCVARQKKQPGRRFFRFEVNDLQKLICRHPCDFISVFWSYEFALAAQGTGIPYVVSLHDVAFQILLHHRDMFRLVRWAMNYMVVTRARHLIANSIYTYHQLDRSTQKKARVIDNFYPSELEAWHGKHPEKGNYMVSVLMGFSHRKNVTTALQAFAQLRRQYPQLEYHLIGAEMEEGGLAQQYANEHGLADGVKFLGLLPFGQVMDLIAGARLLLHPAREESFGMALLEAMVAGTPVVGGSKSGFVPQLLDHGKAGLLCDINSPQEIAQTVSKLLGDQTLERSLIAQGYQHARDHYSENVILAQHLAYYAEILGYPLTAETKVSASDARV